MNPYALIDLHCDTLTDCTHKGLTPDTLDDPDCVLFLNAIPSDVHWAQFYAIFIPDQYRGQAAPLPICRLHGRQERRLLF